MGYILPVNPSDFRFSTPSNYYQMLEYGLLLGSQTRMTPQEINPRWGQSIQIGYAHTPWKNWIWDMNGGYPAHSIFPALQSTTPFLYTEDTRNAPTTEPTEKNTPTPGYSFLRFRIDNSTDKL